MQKQIDDILERLEQENRRVLTEYEAAAVLTHYGIPVVKSELCQEFEQAAEAAACAGYPVALKVVSPDILHKTDAGCVEIGIKNEAELEAAWHRLSANARAYKTDAAIHGLLVQQMASKGIEVIFGVKNDEQFGPVIVFGLGGILVEVLEDVALRSLPFDRAEAKLMMQETKAWKVLQGVRGKPPADIQKLLDISEAISRLVADFPREIAEIDLNPFFVYEAGQGGVAVDALITLK